MKSTVLTEAIFSADDLQAAAEYIEAHPDYTAYHLLFALRRHDPVAYEHLTKTKRALVLADALAHLMFLNDWGYLDPSGSHDGEAAHALLELEEDALESLKPILNDERPAPLFGSETATLSSMYHYRRKDFAYRYVMFLRGSQPDFNPDPEIRDQEIERLQATLHDN